MTTDKEVVDSLTTQGKTISQEEAPPQTIIPSLECTIENKNPMPMVNELLKIANGLEEGSLVWASGGIIVQPSDGKLVVTSDVVLDILDGPIIPAAVDGGAEGIIRIVNSVDAETIVKAGLGSLDDGPGEEDGPWAKDWANRVGGPTIIRDVERQQLVNAEVRRQTVQAEAMVNLAVGVTLMNMGKLEYDGRPVGYEVNVSLQDLFDFQRNYTVTQEVQSDGGFIISVTPRRSDHA